MNLFSLHGNKERLIPHPTRKYPRVVLQPEELLNRTHAEGLFQQATNQVGGDKLSPLKKALSFGSIAAGRTLIKFAKPRDVHSCATPDTKSYSQYLLATALLGDKEALVEFDQLVENTSNPDLLDELNDQLCTYSIFHYDTKTLADLVNLRRINLGRPFNSLKQEPQAFESSEPDLEIVLR